MSVLSRLVEGAEGAEGELNKNIDSFIQEQFEKLLKNPNFRLLTEKLSLDQSKSTEEAKKFILEKMAVKCNKKKPAAANLNLVRR